jgi:hypothetical protein
MASRARTEGGSRATAQLPTWRVNSQQRKAPKPPCGGSPNPATETRMSVLAEGGGEAAQAALGASRCRGLSRRVSWNHDPRSTPSSLMRVPLYLHCVCPT